MAVGRVDQEPPLEALGDHRRGVDREIESDHRSQNADLADQFGPFRLEGLEVAAEPLADSLGAVEQPFLLDGLDRRKPRAAGNRVASESAGVHSRLQGLGDLDRRHHDSRRDAAGKRLGAGQHIGCHAEMLIGEPLAGTPHPRLHLVEDQKGARVVAKPPQAFEIAWSGEVDTSFSLNRLDHDRGGFRVNELGDRFEVVVLRIRKAGDHRLETSVIFRLRGRRERGVGSAVKAAGDGQNLKTSRRVSISPGELDRGFVRLGSAIAKECLAAKRSPRQRLGERPLRFHVPRVGNVDQLANLFANSLDDPRRAMPQEVATPARKEVEIALTLGVPNPRALAPDEANRVSPIVGNDITVELGDRLGRALLSELGQRRDSRQRRN